MGCILNGRGAMELVMAGIAFHKGFIGGRMFLTLVLMGIETTFITAIVFRWRFRGDRLPRYRGEGIA